MTRFARFEHGVPTVASSAARDALITAPIAGQKCYRTDLSRQQRYDGAAWVSDSLLSATGDSVSWPLSVATGLGLTHTWNNAATTYTGVSLAVTNTASHAGSRLLALSADGANLLQVFPTTVALGDAGDTTYSDSGTTIYSQLSIAGTMSKSGGTDRVIPLYINVQYSGSAKARAMRALCTVPATNANNIADFAGLTFVLQHLGSGTIDSTTMLNPGLTLNNAGAVITTATVYGYSGTTKTAGTLTNQIGLQLPLLTQATNNTYLLLGAAVPVAGNFVIYSASTSPSSFAGLIGATQFTATAAVAAVSSGQVGYGGTTQTTVGAAGGASALPATPTGYVIINVAGTDRVFPFYAKV